MQLQSTSLQDKIKVVEALKLFGSFYRQAADPYLLLEQFSLSEKANARFETLSGGQKQRLAIAVALVSQPDVLLLDEPTANLDPQSRRELHAVVKQLRADGRTILLTTHYIEEAQQLCDRLAIIDHGQIIAEGTPDQLIAKSKRLPRVTVSTAKPLAVQQLQSLPAIANADISGQGTWVTTTSVSQTVIALVKMLDEQQNELLDLHVHRPSLEDVFIELTGRSIRDIPQIQTAHP